MKIPLSLINYLIEKYTPVLNKVLFEIEKLFTLSGSSLYST